MTNKIDRRHFLKTASAAAGLTIINPKSVFGTPANSAIRLGIIGCGGRGTGVATSFMKNTDTRVTAITDLFEDRLEDGKNHFNELCKTMGHPEIKNSHLFSGSKGYLKLLESKDVDAVLISSPPFLHPLHLEAAVDAGKHSYCEKPVAIDVHGCNKIKLIGKRAGNSLSIAVGFQIRHATPFVEMVNRIHSGAIGDIVMGEICYYAGFINRAPFPGASPEELRLRHWIYYRELSGDIIIEQNIHVIDIANWVLQAHPVKAVGRGSRAGRNDLGNCWSNYEIIFTYPDNINVSFQSAQFNPPLGDVYERFFGTKGISESHYSGGVFIKGENEWKFGDDREKKKEISEKDWAAGAFDDALKDADPNKQKAFIESIKSGSYINETEAGMESALTGILGRTAAYKGEEVTWDEIVSSGDKWDPMVDLSRYE